MRYMLDTNIVRYAMRARPPELLARLRAVRPADTCISAVTLAELRFGAARSAGRSRYDPLIDAFVSRVAVVPFDAVAASRYGDVRAALEAAGHRIGDLDTLIAAHALGSGCTLVTNNTREFTRVAGLTIEDWSV
jgi:tRNA(fMet)-specific endonuclease VapC